MSQGATNFFQDWNCLAALKKLIRMIRITTAGLRKSMGLASRLKNHLLSIEKEIPDEVLVVIFIQRVSIFGSDGSEFACHCFFAFLQVGLCDGRFQTRQEVFTGRLYQRLESYCFVVH